MGLTRAFVELSGIFFPAELREDKLIVSKGDGLSQMQAKQSLEKIRIVQDNDLHRTGSAIVNDSHGQPHKALFLDSGVPVLVGFATEDKPKRSWLHGLLRLKQ